MATHSSIPEEPGRLDNEVAESRIQMNKFYLASRV